MQVFGVTVPRKIGLSEPWPPCLGNTVSNGLGTILGFSFCTATKAFQNWVAGQSGQRDGTGSRSMGVRRLTDGSRSEVRQEKKMQTANALRQVPWMNKNASQGPLYRSAGPNSGGNGKGIGGY